MGTWTDLEPTCLSYKLCDICYGSCAPPLWYALFSPDDMFVEKTNDGDNYARAETTVRKARNRISKIQQRIEKNAYAKILLAPLQFIKQTLSDLDGNDAVGFDLMEFQQFDGDWGPTCAMEYVETLVFYSKPFDDFIKGSPLAKLIKHIDFNPLGIKGKGKKFPLKEIWKMKIDGRVMELYEYAFTYLTGGGDDNEYDSWVEQNKHIWGKVSAKKSITETTPKKVDKKSYVAEEASVEAQEKPKKQDSTKTTLRNGSVKEHDEDGTLTARLNYKNGKLDGLCKYYNNGKIEKELQYKNDKRNGLCKYWEGGCIKGVSHYKNDRLNGIDEYFEYETEKLLEENVFKNGQIIKKLKRETS